MKNVIKAMGIVSAALASESITAVQVIEVLDLLQLASGEAYNAIERRAELHGINPRESGMLAWLYTVIPQWPVNEKGDSMSLSTVGRKIRKGEIEEPRFYSALNAYNVWRSRQMAKEKAEAEKEKFDALPEDEKQTLLAKEQAEKDAAEKEEQAAKIMSDTTIQLIKDIIFCARSNSPLAVEKVQAYALFFEGKF